MIQYNIWGAEHIDEGSRTQIQNACELPIARKAALMPDAHLGYGLPIGGVLAAENTVIPYGVGVDIACRMRLTLTDADCGAMDKIIKNDSVECENLYDKPLSKGTKFGIGCAYTRSGRHNHAVMDSRFWQSTQLLRGLKDKAWVQMGTSGSGNHFVEWGVSTIYCEIEGLPQGQYVSLLSHSGSRGTGAKVCQTYTKLAKKQNPAGELSWLDLGTQEGQEYWEAMNLMGEYAAANHFCIHQDVLNFSGLNAIGHVENHHNFAWKEQHDGQELIVHRKGATPASKGELGVIPGSMASPTYIIRGKGNADSINSASHGAGRAMSRKAAKRAFSWDEWDKHLKEKNVRVLAAGLDEVPGAYKPIEKVMAAQSDLVEIIGEFNPMIVLMCGDNSRAED